jgi:hypothetical protein
MVARWSARIFDRSEGAKITGTYCVFYSEDDRPFRSKAEVARFLGLDLSGSSQRLSLETYTPYIHGTSEALEPVETVPDEMLEGMPALTGDEAPGPRPAASDPADVLCSLPAEAAGALLHISDFVRAFGPSLQLPPLAGPRDLAVMLCGSTGAQGRGGRHCAAGQAIVGGTGVPGGRGEQQPRPHPRLALLHVRLLQILLGDETAHGWWEQACSMEEHLLGKPELAPPATDAGRTVGSVEGGAAADGEFSQVSVGETELTTGGGGAAEGVGAAGGVGAAEGGPEVWEPAQMVEARLWVGAASAGWRMRVRNGPGRKSCWTYVAPSGALARNKEEAHGMREQEEERAAQVREAAWMRQRVALGMGREKLIGWRVSATMPVPAQPRVRKMALQEPKLPTHAPPPPAQAAQPAQVLPPNLAVQLAGREAVQQPDGLRVPDRAGVGGAAGGGCGALALTVFSAPAQGVNAASVPPVSPRGAEGGLRPGRTVFKGTYMVEALLEFRRRRVGASEVEEWLVKWEGFPASSSSWEPFDNLGEVLRPQAVQLKLEHDARQSAGPATGAAIQRLCSGWVLGFDPATALHQVTLDGDAEVTVYVPLSPDTPGMELLYSVAPPVLRRDGDAPRPATTDVGIASWPALAAAAVVRLSHSGCTRQREPIDESQPSAGAHTSAESGALAAAPRGSRALPAPLELGADPEAPLSPEATPISPEASTSLSDAGKSVAMGAEGDAAAPKVEAVVPAPAKRRSGRMAARVATNNGRNETGDKGSHSKVAKTEAGGPRGGADRRGACSRPADAEAILLRAPLEDGIRSLLAADPAGLAAAYLGLPPVAKLALLGELVHAAAETATVAFAVESQYRLLADEEADESERRRQQRSECELLRSAVGDHLELRKKRPGGQSRKSVLPTSVAEARVAGLVATLVEEAVLPPPALVLSRQELTAAELAEGMELELQAAPLDSTGRRRTPILIERAVARRDEARKRRETLHGLRAEAQAALLSAIARRSREALLSALDQAQGALLMGDSGVDGIGPRKWESSGGGCSWMTSEVRDAYVTLAELALEQCYAAETARRKGNIGALQLRTVCLGRDRWGRRHWALPRNGPEDLSGGDSQGAGSAAGASEGNGEATAAAAEVKGAPLVWVEPSAAAMAGSNSRLPPDVQPGRARAWQLFCGRAASQQLAASLDARGRNERTLQAELRGL